MTVQIVEIAGQKMAVLPIADYERLIDIAEDKAGVLAAAEAELRRGDGEEYLPAAMVDRIIAGESALRVWRKHRAMTLDQLHAATGISKPYLSELENAKRQGKPAVWRTLASALGTAVDDILPTA